MLHAQTLRYIKIFFLKSYILHFLFQELLISPPSTLSCCSQRWGPSADTSAWSWGRHLSRFHPSCFGTLLEPGDAGPADPELVRNLLLGHALPNESHGYDPLVVGELWHDRTQVCCTFVACVAVFSDEKVVRKNLPKQAILRSPNSLVLDFQF